MHGNSERGGAGIGHSVLIASRQLPLITGGLASYQNQLASELISRHHLSVEFQAVESQGRIPQDHAGLPAKWSILDACGDRAFWMRLASRPVLHPLLQAWISRQFRQAFRSAGQDSGHSPDVIHFVGTGWDFAGFGFLDLARRRNARFTVWPAVHSGQWGDDKIDLRLYRQADAVFCQSRHEAEHLQNLGLEASKIVQCVLPPMCLPGRDGHVLRERLDIGTRPAVLFLGRRDQSKGYPALLKAWTLVLSSHPEAVLLVSGPGGSEHAALLQGLPADSVRDLGISDEETKAQALAACDIFCLPTAHESFGIVFAEAWSYGKPVICGPAPASREWIEDGATGLHVDQDPRAIAQALCRLIDHPELAEQMGREGRKYQESHLTWEKTLASHLAAFRM